MIEYIGLIGLTCLVLGWIPQTWTTIKERRGIDWRFGVLYTAGSLFLVIHSININDIVFIILNSFAAVMSGLSLYFTIFPRKL